MRRERGVNAKAACSSSEGGAALDDAQRSTPTGASGMLGATRGGAARGPAVGRRTGATGPPPVCDRRRDRLCEALAAARGAMAPQRGDLGATGACAIHRGGAAAGLGDGRGVRGPAGGRLAHPLWNAPRDFLHIERSPFAGFTNAPAMPVPQARTPPPAPQRIASAARKRLPHPPPDGADDPFAHARRREGLRDAHARRLPQDPAVRRRQPRGKIGAIPHLGPVVGLFRRPGQQPELALRPR